MTDRQTIWISGPISVIGFIILILVFLSGCATQHEYLGHGYRQYVQSQCAWCDTTKALEVHHIKPQHLAPELKNVEANLITLCRPCHFCLGHRCNFKRENPKVADMIDLGKAGAE